MPIVFHFHLQETCDLDRVINRHASESVGRPVKRSPDHRIAQTSTTFGVNTAGFFRFATDARAPEKESHDAGAERFVPELFRADSSWTHFETPTEDGRTINRANLTINRVNPVIGRWEKTLD